ncbi:MAG: phosphoenolpyruvate carboxylase, partial [Pseudomonadota bacterium]
MRDPFVESCLQHDKELRGRVKILGRMLGDVVRAEAGDDIFHLLEKLRKGYIDLRDRDDPEKRAHLVGLIADARPRQLTPIVRAFNLYFQLVNLVEEVFQHRQRRRIAGQAKGSLWYGSFDATMRELRDAGISADDVQTILSHTLYLPVFTAHPTEARRRVIMGLLRKLFLALDELDNPQQFIDQQQRTHNRLRTLIETLWKTEEMRAARPEVELEISNGLYYFRESLFTAVPEVYRRLDNAMERVYRVSAHDLPTVIRFGSWIGGDRDGNPFVTPDTTRHALIQYQGTALEEYSRRVTLLRGELTHARSFCQLPEAFENSLARDEILCAESLGETRKRYPLEPYRRKLYLMHHRLQHNLAHL